MFSDIKKKIRRKIELYNFKRNHRGLYVDGSLQLRLGYIPAIGHLLQYSRRSARWIDVLCGDEGKKTSVKRVEILGEDKRRLIIFAKSEESEGRITNRMLFMNQDKILNKLKMNSGVSEDEWQVIKKKVYVIFDSPIFNVNVIGNKTT